MPGTSSSRASHRAAAHPRGETGSPTTSAAASSSTTGRTRSRSTSRSSASTRRAPSARAHPGSLRGQASPDGGILRGQMRFWLEFYDVVLNCNQTHEDGRPSLLHARERLQPTEFRLERYRRRHEHEHLRRGIYDLGEDEAFLIEASFSGQAGLHEHAPRELVGRVAGLRQPPEQPEPPPDAHGRGRRPALGRRPPRSWSSQLDRHRLASRAATCLTDGPTQNFRPRKTGRRSLDR